MNYMKLILDIYWKFVGEYVLVHALPLHISLCLNLKSNVITFPLNGSSHTHLNKLQSSLRHTECSS